MTDRSPRSAVDRTKVLLFLAAFFQAVGFLFLLACCGSDYWLLAWQSCGTAQHTPSSWFHQDGLGHLTSGDIKSQAVDSVMFFHEGLFWRCSFQTHSQTFCLWDIWTGSQSPIKVCESAFLFPFPVYESVVRPLVDTLDFPPQPSEPDSVIVFRTFWSSFLVVGLVSVTIGGLDVICAAPLSNHKLYKVGGAFQLSGGLSLMVVVLMFLTWFQALGVLEQYASRRRATACPAFHLSVELGPSFLLAPVAVFFCILAGLLFVLIGRDTQAVPNK
ncbi:Transmembrane protein 182 [Merluccius polli]|uniref:Transmembrane protein 182 n=1 Tax=Merluccius polli TaxID=89951 RepID=A0AA47NST5_MERPO|nr:Transmembrane protein 182 [Merluccius polli]